MSAKDYSLAVTGLTNTIWICKQSKKNPHLMTDDRAKIEESTFIGIVLEWLNGKIKQNQKTLQITNDGKVVAEFTIDRVALELKKAPVARPATKKPKTAADVAKILAKGNE